MRHEGLGHLVSAAERARSALLRHLGIPAIIRPREQGTPDATDVFCRSQGAVNSVVFRETEHFEMVTSGFPLAAGHLLIVPKEHIATFADVPVSWHRELEQLVDVGIRFQQAMYGGSTFLREQGSPVERQAVHHAHLHLIPVPQEVTLPEGPGITRVRGWFDVARWRLRHGDYHYVQCGRDRRVVPDVGSGVEAAERVLCDALDSVWDPVKLQPTKVMGPRAAAMVADAAERWNRWEQRQAEAPGVAA